jgi:hypothetical protein
MLYAVIKHSFDNPLAASVGHFLYDETVSSISGRMNSQSSTGTRLGGLTFLLLQCALTALEGPLNKLLE